jgi:hypothetical protein
VILFCLLALPSLRPLSGFQQDSSLPPAGDPMTRPHRAKTGEGPSDNEALIRMQKAAEKKANVDRQLHLKTDTDELFKLATELKQQVDKSNQDVLSIDVIKKADEIERLAHSVKEKMKGQG